MRSKYSKIFKNDALYLNNKCDVIKCGIQKHDIFSFFFLSDAFSPTWNNVSSPVVCVPSSNTHNEFNVCQLIRTDLTLAARTNMFNHVYVGIDVWVKRINTQVSGRIHAATLLYVYYLRCPYEYPMRPLRTWRIHGAFDTYHTSCDETMSSRINRSLSSISRQK